MLFFNLWAVSRGHVALHFWKAVLWPGAGLWKHIDRCGGTFPIPAAPWGGEISGMESASLCSTAVTAQCVWAARCVGRGKASRTWGIPQYWLALLNTPATPKLQSRDQAQEGVEQSHLLHIWVKAACCTAWDTSAGVQRCCIATRILWRTNWILGKTDEKLLLVKEYLSYSLGSAGGLSQLDCFILHPLMALCAPSLLKPAHPCQCVHFSAHIQLSDPLEWIQSQSRDFGVTQV